MEYSVTELRDRLRALDARVVATQSRVTALEQRTEQARLDLGEAVRLRDGARAFVATLEAEEASPDDVRQKPAVAAVQVGNKSVIESILREHPSGIHLRDLQRLAAERGVDLDADQVRSAVTYLRRTGVAHNIRRGVWQPVPVATPLDATGSAEAEPVDQDPSPLTLAAASG